MKKYVFLFLLVPVIAFGQLISNAEYWWDTDPGNGNGIQLTITGGESPTYNGTVPAGSLTNGIHALGVRFEDERGLWGSSEVRYFYVTGTQAPLNTNINAAEYWFDTDPGIGGGQQVGVTAGQNPVYAIPLQAGNLTTGFHSVGFRFRDERFNWGSAEIRQFYVTSGDSSQWTLDHAEYWIDTDPGSGAGQNINITPGPSPQVIVSLPVGNLAIGFHSIGVRFHKLGDSWGSSEVRYFYATGPQEPLNTNILAAEWWMDNDPGNGQGHSVAVTPGQNPSYTIPLPVGNLTTGLHILGFRFEDQRNNWGQSEMRMFYVIRADQAIPGQTITAAEYFVNVDPGEGNGVQINLATHGSWDGTVEAVNDTVFNIPGGMHWLGLRLRDDRGHWSSMMVDSFVVSPLLTAQPGAVSGDLLLRWISAPGVSSSRVFRATAYNGTYQPIASVPDTFYTDPGITNSSVRQYYRVTQITGTFSQFRLPAANQPTESEKQTGESRKSAE